MYYFNFLTLSYDISSNNMKKTIDTTLWEHFQYSIEKSQKETKATPLTHKNMLTRYIGLILALQLKVARLNLLYSAEPVIKWKYPALYEKRPKSQCAEQQTLLSMKTKNSKKGSGGK